MAELPPRYPSSPLTHTVCSAYFLAPSWGMDRGRARGVTSAYFKSYSLQCKPQRSENSFLYIYTAYGRHSSTFEYIWSILCQDTLIISRSNFKTSLEPGGGGCGRMSSSLAEKCFAVVECAAARQCDAMSGVLEPAALQLRYRWSKRSLAP